MKNEDDLEKILKEMLEDDRTITYRSIAVQHPNFKYASSISRNNTRKILVEKYQYKQNLIRQKAEELRKKSQHDLIDRITTLEAINKVLLDKNEKLILSHNALYKAVGELGGLPLWEKMFNNYQDYLDLFEGVINKN